jgi:hypothetical protein
MPRYRVLISWTNDAGEHAPGDLVTLTRDSPAEEVEPATMTAEEPGQDSGDEPESTSARRRTAKK